MKRQRLPNERDLDVNKWVHDAQGHDVQYNDDLQFTCYTCETVYFYLGKR